MIHSLDAHDKPPEFIKSAYKRYQKLTLEAIQSDPTILDFHLGLSDEQQCRVRQLGSVSQSTTKAACSHLGLAEAYKGVASSVDVPIYETEAVPGEPWKIAAVEIPLTRR